MNLNTQNIKPSCVCLEPVLLIRVFVDGHQVMIKILCLICSDIISFADSVTDAIEIQNKKQKNKPSPF